jgi:isoleucyl-tRNA synthetase
MPFEKVDTQVDFPKQEREILEFWRRIDVFEKLRAKNRGGPRWSFLDGPITANNPMGVHHAWGRTYKDAYQRYHAMNGSEERYQNGFDCQGLWVEVEVEKELGLKSKRDIENLVPGDVNASIDKFVQLCKQRVDKYARIQTEQSIRLGYWMDWDRDEDWARPPDRRRSYFTMSEENNYTIWAFLKKCHGRGLIYRGYDAMPWCPRCSVGLSQMEMAEGYQLVAHRAVFVRFPLRGRPGENLLVWTTTPWTLSSNVAAAVNPELTYLKVSHRDQIYYLAKGAFTARRLEEQFKQKEWKAFQKLKPLEQIFKEKGGFAIVGKVQGSEMVGWAYDGPFDELPAQQHPLGYPAAVADAAKKAEWTSGASPKEAHRVIAWEDVGEAEGTGIVHIAPGCGKEDFQLGKDDGLPPVAPLDEFGCFLPGFGELTGNSAVAQETTDWILDNLKQKGLLLEVEKYPHSYPHCWRCKTELLFRLVDEWFINMSWRDEIKDVVRQSRWLPPEINGQARELDWLTNMGDWMISKKRFWGLALPIWVDEATGDFEVIGSREELKQRAVEGWPTFEGHTPHRPWVDQVKIRNPKTGNLMSRIPDVGNPWLDAGIVPFSTMKYNTDREYWKKWFPADFVTEAFPGQFRNWFYAMLAMSTMMVHQSPFKTLLGHGLVRDEHGEEMHKAKGNSIPFDEAADKMGADLMRWMYCRTNPAGNVNFGYHPADELRSKFTIKLWNSYAFFCDNARQAEGGFDLSARSVPVKERPDLDRWILSDLQKLIQTARTAFESYDVMTFCQEAERFVDAKLSNWYVRRSKRRFWKGEQGADKLAAYQTLHTVLMTLAKLFAPIMPFLSETMDQNLKTAGGPESVHLCDFPRADGALIDPGLSYDMNALLLLVSLGLAARNAGKRKVRQPLAEMVVASELMRPAVERFEDLLRDELNIRQVRLHHPDNGALLQTAIKPNLKRLGQKHGNRLPEIQAAIEAEVRRRKQLGGTGIPREIMTPNGPVSLDPEDLWVERKAPDGWAGAAEGATEVMVDCRITEELALAGMAREVVRHVNDLRKTANLNIEDRIVLYLGTDGADLKRAIEAHRDYIAPETLTVRWAESPDGLPHRQTVKIEGQTLTIALAKAQ